MTASKVNLGGGASKTKKVVSSTLAGVLAVGMIPAAGFAAEAADEGVEDADIELLDSVSGADTFSKGTISDVKLDSGSASLVAGTTNQYTITKPDSAVSTDKLTFVLKGVNQETIADTNYDVAVTNSNNETVTSIANVGTYTVTVTAKKNSQYAGGSIVFTLKVTGVALEAANLTTYNINTFKPTDASAPTWAEAQAAQEYVYNTESQEIGLALKNNTDATILKEGKDYTVVYYKLGNEQTSYDQLTDAGTYYARVTGIGDYSGTVNLTTSIEIDPFTPTATNVVFGVDGFIYGDAKLPVNPTSFEVYGKKYTKDSSAAAANILNNIFVNEWLDSSQSGTTSDMKGTFTGFITTNESNNLAELTDASNVEGKITRVGSEATINYQGTPLDQVTQPVVIDLSKKQTFKDTDITVFNGDEQLINDPGDSSATPAVPPTTYYEINWSGKTADNTAFTGPGAPTKAGEYTATITVTDPSKANEFAGEGTLDVKIINGVIDCATNMTVSYDADGSETASSPEIVTEINAIYSGKNIIDNITNVIVVNNAKPQTQICSIAGDGTGSNDGYVEITYKDSNGNVVTDIKDAGSYTMEVTSSAYELTNNTIQITVAPETVTGLQMDATQLATVNGQPAFNSTDTAPTVTDILNSKIQYKTNKTEAAVANAKAAWTAVTSATPLDNFTFAITGPDGKAVDLSKGDTVLEPGTYTVSLKATDAENANYTGEATCTFNVAVQQKFQDVPADAWYYDYVNDVTSNPLEYMKGYAGTDTFGPNDNIIRGDVAVVLFRMAGGKLAADDDFSDSDVTGFVTGFADCDATAETRGMYYNQAIAWAKANGIVTGYAGTDEFRPQNKVTREEFATMLTRYAALSKDTSASNDLSKYPDGSTVSDWAKAAMEYVTAEGIMNGIGSTDEVLGPLAPQANVTRAEVAKMVYVEQPTRITPLV